ALPLSYSHHYSSKLFKHIMVGRAVSPSTSKIYGQPPQFIETFSTLWLVVQLLLSIILFR
ncbi:MAG: hypothetical protein KC713_05880, partial [Candidatus Omnitrophica bacterium]|nr:hypothetical protein [Candidatus Omnitrophota bacterium]